MGSIRPEEGWKEVDSGSLKLPVEPDPETESRNFKDPFPEADCDPFQTFCSSVQLLVTKVAESKGYRGISIEPSRFIQQHFGNGHMVGEIILKLVRYQRRGDQEDLLKAAGWLFILWRDHLKQIEERR